MLKKSLCILFSFCILISMVACSYEYNDDEEFGGQNHDFPVTVNGITIKKAPKSVAVLSGSLADVIIACGYEVLVEARSSDCTQAAVALKTDVGAPDSPDINALKDLKISLVLTDSPLDTAIQTELDKARIPVVVIEPASSRADFERLYTDVCSALNGGKTGYEKGVNVSDSIYISIDGIGRVLPKTDTPPTACYIYNTDGDIATGDTLAGELIEAAGAFNIAANSVEHKMDIDQISIADPSFIFCAEGTKSSIMQSDTFKGVEAVKSGNVFELPANLMLWQGKTVLDAVSSMAEYMSPYMADRASSSNTSSISPENNVSSKSNSSSSTSSATEYQTLRPDDEGEKIMELQNRLIELGYMDGPADGKYGDITVDAVYNFQLKVGGLTADGIAGAKTLEKLFSDNAPHA